MATKLSLQTDAIPTNKFVKELIVVYKIDKNYIKCVCIQGNVNKHRAVLVKNFPFWVSLIKKENGCKKKYQKR